jgi:Fe-S cluster biogenesis protein NfuA|tara:strand:- start:1925 stop:2545 length:621 start_codon:yes stop_codon:yes gene_type:complete
MSRPVTIYAEMTPNPNTMKFVADHMLVNPGDVVEFLSSSDAKGNSTLAEALFNFPFVTRIFITQNFVTVYKNNLVEWSDISLELREFIREWLSVNEEPVQNIPELEILETVSESKQKTTTNIAPVINTEMDQKIVDLINEYIQPAVEQDGGAIHFQSFDTDSGQVTVILKGSCSGCPSSTATLKGGVENLLKTHIPEITEVVALNG